MDDFVPPQSGFVVEEAFSGEQRARPTMVAGYGEELFSL